MKFLVLRFSSIGDIVLTTPVVRCLRKQYPDAEIHFATKQQFASLLSANPYINQLHLLGDSDTALVAELKPHRFDYIIDLHHNARTALIKMQLGVPAFSFDKINRQKWMMVHLKWNRLPAVHIVDRYLDTCRTLGVVNDGEGLDFFIPEDARVNVQDLPDAFRQGYIAWVIGAKHQTKKFPMQKIVSILQQLDLPVVLLGGKEDEQEAKKIVHAAGKTVFNACGKFSLMQSASLLQQAKAVVANDTGLMHIAAALRKPIVSLWGSTIPEFGMSPYYGRQPIANAVIENKTVACRPCHKIGRDHCPKGHFDCMNKIDEQQVLQAVRGLV